MGQHKGLIVYRSASLCSEVGILRQACDPEAKSGVSWRKYSRSPLVKSRIFSQKSRSEILACRFAKSQEFYGPLGKGGGTGKFDSTEYNGPATCLHQVSLGLKRRLSELTKELAESKISEFYS